ncbi:MAG: bifunctional metallophosphatase/5'-nucleotidase [Flavobacteriales bacterium]
MLNRRQFIAQSTLACGALSLPLSMSAQATSSQKITILHTNDVHSHVDPFPKNHSRYANQGGAAARAQLIKTIRQEEQHVVLLDAGDIFQGTPYFNLFEGQVEYDLMNYMQYDAATLGNHDFDLGMESLVKQLKRAKFPMLNANYDLSETILNQDVNSHCIIKKGNINIGIYGLGIDPKGLIPDQLCEGLVYTDPIQVMLDQENQLKTLGCDLIICLSHLGFEYKSKLVSDKILAQHSKFTHLILGGHTHTFLEKPFEFLRQDGSKILVNQAGWAGLQLGRIDLEISSQNELSFVKSENLNLSLCY